MKTSVSQLLCLILALLLGWGSCAAARADGLPIVSIKNDPDFSDVRIQLQALVNAFGFHNANHFCIITYEAPKGSNELTPFIYWPTQNKLIEWGTGPDPSILGAGHYFDLTRDVLPDTVNNGENTSPDYLTRSDVNRIIKDCMTRGDRYTVNRSSDGWVPISKFPQFSSVATQLQYLVDNNTSPKVNDFCVIGQKDGAFLAAYVYWKTKNQLIIWLPSKYDLDDPFAVADSDINIDLKHDLREEEDAEDNRNEMQRSYAATALRACQSAGQNFVINKSN